MRSRVHPLAYLPAFIMLLLILMPMGLMRLAKTNIVLTNRRILGRVRNQRISMKYDEIDSITVSRGIMGIAFNYGAITINGNGARTRFSGIIAPKAFKQMIDQEVEKALFGELLAKENDAPTAEPINVSSKTAQQPQKQEAPPPIVPKLTKTQKQRKNVDPNQW